MRFCPPITDMQPGETSLCLDTILLAQDASLKITTYSSTYATAGRAGHCRKLLQETKKVCQQMTYLLSV
jgi:hypothetical protein